ncbi:MAG: DNA-directed RNA polymerase subunit omega [candidate division Zixibacteria bacterium]|nr:DNA-directed RNA polymerase subunit omega [candidate division Zixibacteria bacterium]
MPIVPTDDFKKLSCNRYEAVIIAAQHARHLNLQRLASLEKMEEDATVDIEARKITMVALKELVEGKIEFARPEKN